VSFVETALAERVPTLTLPRKREREWIVLGANSFRHPGDTITLSARKVEPPLPLAGEVLRFSNHDVMTNRAGVLETIATAIAERAPILTLPRKRERGQEKQSS
jgi:hypothetical protein